MMQPTWGGIYNTYKQNINEWREFHGITFGNEQKTTIG